MDKILPSFQVYAKRKNASKKMAHLYLRISYQTDTIDRSTGLCCHYKDWQPETSSVKKDELLTYRLKEKIDIIRQKVLGAFYILHQSSPDVSLQEVVAVALDEKKARAFSVYICFEELIEKMIKSKSEASSGANIQKHKVVLKHLRNYVSGEYGWNDFPFARINRLFIEGFTEYLKTKANCSHNTVMKQLGIFKKVYRVALDNQWIRSNAFSGFRMCIKPVVRIILTEEEIHTIARKEMPFQRLELVRDLFIFACFTGLAYIDLKNLRRKNLEENLGISWIKTRRTKTGVDSTIPLLQPARNILNKWASGWEHFPSETLLFKVFSNQKTNAYLKEIAILSGIFKPVSFHIARHSFATSIALCNNIPIETVSKMLGHSRISMTQHYSKVVDLKIARDTGYLMEKYSNTGNPGSRI